MPPLPTIHYVIVRGMEPQMQQVLLRPEVLLQAVDTLSNGMMELRFQEARILPARIILHFREEVIL